MLRFLTFLINRVVLSTVILISILQVEAHHPSELPKIGVRNAHAMAYDSAHQRVILFGGADESKVCGDTWEWNGKVWRLLNSSGPIPRTFPAMAYDSFHKRVILFGGNAVLFGKSPDENKFLNDTWEWDGHTWTQKNVSGPSPRAEAAMAYDSARKRIVLFGGHNRSGAAGSRFGDTWEWDGNNWNEVKVTGPTARNSAAMVYDNVHRKIVLFGGSTAEFVSGETWEWDGKQWLQNRTGSVEGRFNCVMAYDSARRKVVRFGGRFAGKPLGDTWEYDGKTWTQVISTGPTPRNHSAMAYDTKRKRIVMFGGHDFGLQDEVHVFGDTWEWDGVKWKVKDPGQILPRVENGH